MNVILAVALGLVLLRWVAQVSLDALNRRHIRQHSGAVPQPFRDFINPEAYAKSVAYSLAKSRLAGISATWSMLLLFWLFLSGWLPDGHTLVTEWAGMNVWGEALYLFLVGCVVEMCGWPIDWYGQFRLEERFGFNTTTPATWWMDRLKGFFLAALLGYPVLVAVLFLAEVSGSLWWVWAWAAVAAFQLFLMVVGPALILPLFNRLTPLPEGSLRRQLFQLAERVGFPTRDIQVMDGSRRSRHANAFFTGFGRFRKIVLFDTLIAQLNEDELTAVLAHEIGHYKKKHVLKMLAWSLLTLLGSFWIISVAAKQPWLLESFGFFQVRLAPVYCCSDCSAECFSSGLRLWQITGHVDSNMRPMRMRRP